MRTEIEKVNIDEIKIDDKMDTLFFYIFMQIRERSLENYVPIE